MKQNACRSRMLELKRLVGTVRVLGLSLVYRGFSVSYRRS